MLRGIERNTNLIVCHFSNIYWVYQNGCRKLKRGSTTAGQVQKSAPLYCEVKIICDGKEVTTAATADPTPPLSPSPVNNSSRSNNPTPPSSTPNHDNAATNGDKNGTQTRERKKIAKFLRCLSFWLSCDRWDTSTASTCPHHVSPFESSWFILYRKICSCICSIFSSFSSTVFVMKNYFLEDNLIVLFDSNNYIGIWNLHVKTCTETRF